MQPILLSLETLQVDLREAVVRQDWEVIGELDLRCRELVREVRKIGDSALREPVEALSKLYTELQWAARQERERIAGELRRLSQSKQVDQAYKAFER